MRSAWVEHKGKQILYQDSSKHLFNSAAVKAELNEVQKIAVLGMMGMKRKLADLLTALTGQPLKYFDDIESAKNWRAD